MVCMACSSASSEGTLVISEAIHTTADSSNVPTTIAGGREGWDVPSKGRPRATNGSYPCPWVSVSRGTALYYLCVLLIARLKDVAFWSPLIGFPGGG